jgi:6-phosphogluconolactonase
MMSFVELRVFDDPLAAANAAAEWVARRIRAAVARRGRAAVAVSGGSTPALMFAALALLPVPWAALHVFQVDERVVPDDDPERNVTLLDVLPLNARQLIAMPVTARDLTAAARRYAAKLPDRFDVVHLGLGDDGHTASWPPGDPVIDSPRPVDLCREYRGHVRMTLTPSVVNAARSRLLLATGAAKAPVLEGWLSGDRNLPVQRVRRTGALVILDRAAFPGEG